jgi:hypothetical protein
MTAVVAAVLPFSVSASTITDGGLEAGFGCTNGPACGNGSETFKYSGPAPFAVATGSLSLDLDNLLLDFVWTISSGTFRSWDPIALEFTGSDNGVDEIEFTDVTYSASGLGLSHLGGGIYTVSGTLNAAGTYEQFLGGGSVVGPTTFDLGVRVGSGQCTTAGGPLVCHFDFGPGGPFALDVGTTPSTRRFQHTFNVISAPEPGTMTLMAGGLIALASARRRRS